MSRLDRYGRLIGWLVVLGALAGVLGTAIITGLEAVGVPPARASPIAIAVAVSVALSVADVYTPLGRGPRTEGIQEKAPAALAVDFVLAGAVAAAASALLSLGGALVWSPLGNELLVLLVGTGAGYGAFMLRNREFYLRERPEPEA